jgi:hypothetical protein
MKSQPIDFVQSHLDIMALHLATPPETLPCSGRALLKGRLWSPTIFYWRRFSYLLLFTDKRILSINRGSLSHQDPLQPDPFCLVDGPAFS